MNVKRTNNIKIYTNKQSFGGVADKVAKDLITIPERQLRKLEITYDEAVRCYEVMGFSVVPRKGSHTMLRDPNGASFPLIIPHGGKKGISTWDIERLRDNIRKYFQFKKNP